MDGQILRLISTAAHEKDVHILKEAFDILDPESQKSNERVNMETISQNLYVECAETAIKLNEIKIANKCIQIYFNLPMISNQFLARSYLCQFQLQAPNNTNQLENLEKSIPYLLKAIEFSKHNKRYNFLIYNASVIFWKNMRIFFKANFKRYLSASLQVIVDSLNEIDDADYEWRAILTRMLIECYLDNKDNEKAAEQANTAEALIKTRVPNMYNEFFTFAVANDLFDDGQIERITKGKSHLQAICRIENMKTKKNKPGTADEVYKELNDLYIFIVGEKFNDDTMKPAKQQGSESLKIRLLLKLTHVCILYDETSLCSLVIGYLKEKEALNEEQILEIELIECEQTVKELKHKQEKYNKQSVRIRMEAIRRCDELVRDSVRLNNTELIQLGCIIQWNLCLPLLQPGLRKDVRKPLQYVCECLNDIESMEWLLRCQIHFEVSKCEEEIEQLQVAEQHLLKAIQLDDHKVYQEQLSHALHRLRLRAELYKIPERLEDQVAVIIEQSIKLEKNVKLESGKSLEINTRSLLMRAADLLAKQEFGNVMESETFKPNIGKLNEDIVSKLVAKSRNYTNCTAKCRMHINDRLRELNRKYEQNTKDEIESYLRADYKERLKLWFDLCKIARKQQLWDVCRVASRFCILYDDDKLISRFIPISENNKTAFFNKELMRNLAEAHFIKAEALIQFIRGENIELFEKPKPPQPSELVAQKHRQRNFDTDAEWFEYVNWLQTLCDEIIQDFLRGIKFGIMLNESWIVCQGAAYCWNYLHHLFEQKKHYQVIQILAQLLEAFKKVGHAEEPQLLTNICNALATGLISSFLPPEQTKSLNVPRVQGVDMSILAIRDEKSPVRKGAKAAITGSTPEKSQSRTHFVASETLSELKTALDVCEYALQVTNGESPAKTINLKDRLPLIKTWVLAKQMMQSPIKNFGLQQNAPVRPQDKYTKALVAIEILDRNTANPDRANIDAKETPTIKEVIEMVEEGTPWPDRLIELQLWCRIAILSNKFNDTESLRMAYSRAIDSVSYFEKKKLESKTIYISAQCLLSQTCIALGEHIAGTLNPGVTGTSANASNSKKEAVQQATPQVSITSSQHTRTNMRREAANALADACGYAAKAENYELVIHAARQFWNLCLPHLKQQAERATLVENLREILKSLVVSYKLRKVAVKADDEKEKSDSRANDETQSPVREKPIGAPILKSRRDTDVRPSSNKVQINTAGTVSDRTPVAASIATQINKLNFLQSPAYLDAFDDLTLRSALYGCLFQVLIDKNEYDEALKEMDCALNEMPRTKHRLLIYRFRIMTKAKLGLDVQMDLQKFKEESEKNLAQMYRKVALSSNTDKDIIVAYQRAIDALNSEESQWLKFEYLLELGQWLYSNEYEFRPSVDLIEWALDIVTNIKTEKPASATTTSQTTISGTSKRSKNKHLSINDAHRSKSQQPSQLMSNSENNLKSESDIEFDNIRLVIDPKKEKSMSAKFPLLRTCKITDLQDIRQLECLIRGNIVLARMTPRSSPDYNNYLVKGFCFIQRIMQQAIENGFYSLKEVQRLNALNTEQNVDKKKTDQKGGNQKNKSPDLNAHKTHTARKLKIDFNPAAVLPQTLEDWSVFDLHEEIVNAWLHEIMKKNGLNFHTISEPFLLFHYLDMFGDMLNEEGYTHFLFAVYNLQILLVKTALKQTLNKNSNSTLSSQLVSIICYIRLKLIKLCVELNLIQSIPFQQQAIVSCIYGNNVMPSANPTTQTNAAQQAQTQSTTQAIANAINAINAIPSLILKLIEPDPFEISMIREEVYIYNQNKIPTALAKDNDEADQRKTSDDNSIGPKASNKAQKKQMFADSDQNRTKYMNRTTNNTNYIGLPGEQKIINNQLSEILFKDVWILIADLLIRNGHMQNARDFLYEAFNTSQNFNDENTMARAEYLLGEIALFDSNYLEATNFALKAQKTPIDEKFWLKSILLLAKATKLDSSNKSANEKSTAILNRALDVCMKECSKRPNKKNQFKYMQAIIIYELANLLYDKVKSKPKDSKSSYGTIITDKLNTMRSSVYKELIQVCKMYENSVEILLSEGYKRAALPIIKAHSDLLRRFADDCLNHEAKHDYLLQSYLALNEGCTIATELWYDLQATQTYTSTQGACLPMQREYVKLKLDHAELSAHIYEVHLAETKALNLKNLNKDHVIKTHDEYMKNKTDKCESEIQWELLQARIPDEVFSNLMSCFGLAQKIKQLKAKTLYLMGRTLRLIDDFKIEMKSTMIQPVSNQKVSIQPLTKWDNKILEFVKAEHAQLQNLYEQETIKTNQTKSKPSTTHLKSTTHDDGTPGSDMDSYDHGAHMSDINSEKNTGITSVTGGVIMGGMHSPNASTINAVQNAQNSTQQRRISLNDSQSYFDDTSASIKLIERENVKTLLANTNCYDSQAMEILLQALNLAYATDDKELIGQLAYELIEITGRLDLHLCSQFIALYQSASNGIEIEEILKKCIKDPKTSLLAGYLRQMSYLRETSIKTNILNAPMIKQLNDVMKNKYVALKYLNISPDHINLNSNLPTNYVLLSLQHNSTKTELYGAVLDRVKPVQTIKNNQKQQPTIQILPPTKAMSIKVHTDDKEFYELQHQWRLWKADLQAFNLRVEFYNNHEVHKRQLMTTVNTSRTAQSEENNLNINLNLNKSSELTDVEKEIESRFQSLMQRTEDYLEPITVHFQSFFNSHASANAEKPLEKPSDKLIILADVGLFEFPLEALKLFQNSFSISSISRDFSLQFLCNRYYSEKDDAENSDGKDEKKPQKSKSLSYKQTNASEPLPESALVVDPVRFRYLVDIYGEASNSVPVEYHPINSFKTLTQQYPNVTSKWQGVCGGTVPSSLGEREQMLANSNCLLFYGMERLLSYFQSTKVPVSNLNDCYLVIANDLAQSSKSSNRISKNDVLKSFTDVNLEQPLQTAVLLSLSGIKCIMSNQWSCSLVENSNKFQHVFKEFMTNQHSSGEIVRYRIAPHVKTFLQSFKVGKKDDDKKSEKDKKQERKVEANKSKELNTSQQQQQHLTDRSIASVKKTVTSRSDKNSLFETKNDENSLSDSKSESINRDKCNLVCYGLPDIFMLGSY